MRIVKECSGGKVVVEFENLVRHDSRVVGHMNSVRAFIPEEMLGRVQDAAKAGAAMAERFREINFLNDSRLQC